MDRTQLCNKGQVGRVAYPRTVEVFHPALLQALLTDVEECTLSLKRRCLNPKGRYRAFGEWLLARELFQQEDSPPCNCTSSQIDLCTASQAR